MNGEILVTATPKSIYWLNRIVFDENNKFINKNYFRGIANAYKVERLPDCRYHCYAITSITNDLSDFEIFDIKELYIFPKINRELVLECQRRQGFVEFDPKFDYMRYFLSEVYPEIRFPLGVEIEYHYVQLFETGFDFVKYLNKPLIYNLRSLLILEEDTPTESFNKFKFGDFISVKIGNSIEPCYYIADLENNLHLITYDSLGSFKEDYLKNNNKIHSKDVIITVVKEDRISKVEETLEKVKGKFKVCTDKFINDKIDVITYKKEIEGLFDKWVKFNPTEKVKG